MGRRPTYFVSDEEMKKYILEGMCDENGKKVSIRDLFNSEEFMNNTGYFRYQEGQKQAMSMGTIECLREKLGVTDEFAYEYHKKKGRINVPFDEWKGTKHKKIARTLANFKSVIITFFKLDEDEVYGLNVADLKLHALAEYLSLGFSEEDFDNDFRYLMDKHKVTNRMLIENRHVNANS